MELTCLGLVDLGLTRSWPQVRVPSVFPTLQGWRRSAIDSVDLETNKVFLASSCVFMVQEYTCGHLLRVIEGMSWGPSGPMLDILRGPSRTIPPFGPSAWDTWRHPLAQADPAVETARFSSDQRSRATQSTVPPRSTPRGVVRGVPTFLVFQSGPCRPRPVPCGSRFFVLRCQSRSVLFEASADGWRAAERTGSSCPSEGQSVRRSNCRTWPTVVV